MAWRAAALYCISIAPAGIRQKRSPRDSLMTHLLHNSKMTLTKQVYCASINGEPILQVDVVTRTWAPTPGLDRSWLRLALAQAVRRWFSRRS